MNPETNKFEPLSEDVKKFNEAMAKLKGAKVNCHINLLRPDGSPVPIHWSVFKVGELVMIKDYTFRVAYIGESNILFEPVHPEDSLKRGSNG